MVSEAVSKQLLWGPLNNDSGSYQGVDIRGAKGGGGDRESSGGGGGINWRTRGVRDGGGGTDTEKEMTQWDKVVELAREDFGEGRLAEECMWQAVVLIPKGKED